MELILTRHGNTFEPSEKAYFVGAKEDLPLASTASLQARAIANTLYQQNKIPTHIYSGNLKRLADFSNLISHAFSASLLVQIDPRLNEIDYGAWGGLTKDEIKAQFGQFVFMNWDRRSVWPKHCHWGESEEGVKTRIRTFVDDLIQSHRQDDRVLVVTSNGCLRYFLHLIPDEWEMRIRDSSFKVGTGCFCFLRYHKNQWQLKSWNIKP